MPGSALVRALGTLQESFCSTEEMAQWFTLSHCLQADPLSQSQPIIPAYLEALLEPWAGVCSPERHRREGGADAASTQQGSSVKGILQARILEWVAIPFSRRTFQPRDQTWVSHVAGKFFTI